MLEGWLDLQVQGEYFISVVKQVFLLNQGLDSILRNASSGLLWSQSSSVFTAGSFATVGRCAAIISCVHNTRRNPGAFRHFKHWWPRGRRETSSTAGHQHLTSESTWTRRSPLAAMTISLSSCSQVTQQLTLVDRTNQLSLSSVTAMSLFNQSLFRCYADKHFMPITLSIQSICLEEFLHIFNYAD